MRELWSLLNTVISPGTFNQMLRSATPVALAAMGGALTEHAGIMNIGMDGMILLGAFVGVIGSYLAASATVGVLGAVAFGAVIGLYIIRSGREDEDDEFDPDEEDPDDDGGEEAVERLLGAAVRVFREIRDRVENCARERRREPND